MSLAKITLYGMYQYMNGIGGDLFSGMRMPAGIDIERLKDTIILRGGEFETLYGSPHFMENAIRVWSERNASVFEHWVDAWKKYDQFNPLENYDRMEDWVDTSHAEGETEQQRSAYDSDDYQPVDKMLNNGDGNNHHVGRIHGNVGVTKTSDLLASSLSVAEWNTYDHIAELFISEFCICVYT